MQIKCEYCGAYIEEKDEFCSHCGAVNENFKRAVDGTPKTIEELKAWYADKNLPPAEVTRFFIGEDYKKPRAFGIYEKDGQFVVYKNKDDGSRAIRYSGKDEAYAVNELYLRLKSEILNQKAHNINNGSAGSKPAESKTVRFIDKIFSAFSTLSVIAFVGFAAVALVIGAIDYVKDKPYAGKYYGYGDDVYYCESYVNDSWYWYDSSNRDYIPVSIPSEMYDDIQSYRFSSGEVWDNGIEKFEDSEMGQYVESLKESDSDSDYSWDSSDSWDSDSSDWGSDW